MILGATIKLKDQFTATMKNAQKATGEMSKSMKLAGLQANKMKKDFKEAYEAAKPDNMFDSATKIGAGMTAMGVAGAAALGAATKMAIDFESAFAGVRKTVDATEEEFSIMKSQIRAMAKEIPATHEEIAAVAEAAGQLGIQKDAIMGFTRVMIDLGVASNMTSDEAATSLARFANITQMSAQDYDRLGATIVDLGNNLATTEGEIVEMGLRLAGAGSQIGMSEAQILSFAGALSSVGISADAGGSAFSKVMIAMASDVATNGKNLSNFAKVSGMSVTEFKNAFQKDAAGAIISFTEGLGKMSAAGGNVFGILDEMGMSEIRVRDALLRASGAGDLFRQSMETGTNAWDENVALSNEAAQRYATTESQLKMLKNIMKDIGISVGDIILPNLINLIERTKDLLAPLDKMSDKTKKMITFIALGGTAFMLLVGPLLLLIGMLPAIAAGFAMVNAVFLASPIGLIVLGIIALVAAIAYLWKTNEGFRESFKGVWESIKTIISSVLKIIVKAFEKAWPVITRVIEAAWNVISPIFSAMAKGLEIVAKGVKWVADKFDASPTEVKVTGKAKAKGHAAGLSYVPYDNYPALLHRGETVLPRRDADHYRAGSSGVGAVTITGNTFHVREEADIDKIVNALAAKLRQSASNRGRVVTA